MKDRLTEKDLDKLDLRVETSKKDREELEEILKLPKDQWAVRLNKLADRMDASYKLLYQND